MNFTKTEIPDIWVIEPTVLGDSRGYFMEAFKRYEFEQFIGVCDFLQDNESCSTKGVWRGFHFQLEPYAQSKLVRIIQGNVLDVAVDIRKGSPTFGKFVAVELSGENKRQLFIPKGFAHGFYVLSDNAVFTYKVDNHYMPDYERSICFSDPEIGIESKLPAGQAMIMSDKDRQAPFLRDTEINYIYKK